MGFPGKETIYIQLFTVLLSAVSHRDLFLVLKPGCVYVDQTHTHPSISRQDVLEFLKVS